MDTGPAMIVKPDEVIFNEGGEGVIMYILLEGEVELRKKVGKGETVLKTLSSPNEFFGEMALIDGRPRSATAVATKTSKLLPVDGLTFEKMILTNGRFALKIIKVLSERIRHSNSAIEELHGVPPRERFLRGLSAFAKLYGDKMTDGSIRIAVTQLRAWTNSRLGFSVEDCDAFILEFLKAGIVANADKNSRKVVDIVVTPKTLREAREAGAPGS